MRRSILALALASGVGCRPAAPPPPPPALSWTYNGAPPHAGSFLLDGVSPGARTWGWIAWRWNISLWYVWDALYWHDRHNRNGLPLPGKPLMPAADPTSFNDGGDRPATEALAARVVPRALGDAPKKSAQSWSADESDWERARRELIQLATCAP